MQGLLAAVGAAGMAVLAHSLIGPRAGSAVVAASALYLGKQILDITTEVSDAEAAARKKGEVDRSLTTDPTVVISMPKRLPP